MLCLPGAEQSPRLRRMCPAPAPFLGCVPLGGAGGAGCGGLSASEASAKALRWELAKTKTEI